MQPFPPCLNPLNPEALLFFAHADGCQFQKPTWKSEDGHKPSSLLRTASCRKPNAHEDFQPLQTFEVRLLLPPSGSRAQPIAGAESSWRKRVGHWLRVRVFNRLF